MSGFRVDRLLASTAIALLLALPAAGTFAGSENNPAGDASTASRLESQAGNANQPAASKPAEKASNDAPAVTTKPQDAAAPANNSTEKPAAEAKPAASADTAQPGEPAKSAAETKPAETKPGEAKPSDTAVTGTPAAAPVAAGPDAAIAEQLRELGNGKFDRIIGSEKDRTPIEAFYSSRNYAPLWIADGKPNARAAAAIGYLRHVDGDGLDPADYPVPTFAMLTAPAVTYARHASVGRVHWSRVSGDIEYSTPAAEPDDVLAAIAGASDVATALDSYEPQTPGYRALKAKLA